jgi:hypothetical protein
VFGGGPFEPADQFLAGGEVGLVAVLGGQPGQADRQHCFSDPGRPDEKNVGGVVEETQGGQLADELLVDTGLGGEVVGVERPRRGQVREVQPGGDLAVLGRGDLDAQQRLDRLQRRQLPVPGGVEHLG